VVDQDAQQVTFERDITVTNYSGTTFSLTVRRNVQLLDDDAIARAIGRVPGDSLRVVGFESDNRVTNTGLDAWRKDTGAVSIWILGQFRPGPKTTVVLPFVAGPAAERGPIVNDAYFGPIGPGRLRTGHDAVFLRADGAKRGKIGLPPRRARDVAGSYDPDMRVLTLIEFTHPAGATDYVNSMWEHQKQPFAGDVVNAYNDGPLGPGQPPLGPFYEVESSSPAALLGPGDSITHVHRTVHIQGPEAELDAIAREKLGVSLAEMTRW
jgi:hypothetical protein